MADDSKMADDRRSRSISEQPPAWTWTSAGMRTVFKTMLSWTHAVGTERLVSSVHACCRCCSCSRCCLCCGCFSCGDACAVIAVNGVWTALKVHHRWMSWDGRPQKQKQSQSRRRRCWFHVYVVSAAATTTAKAAEPQKMFMYRDVDKTDSLIIY